MLRRLLVYNIRSNTSVRHNSSISECSLSKKPNSSNITLGSDEIERSSASEVTKSVLDPLDEDISHVSTYLKPTFNIGAYINKSDTLQQLLKLGVNFHKIEKNVEAVPFILGLKFEDIKEHIVFLKDLKLTTEEIGHLITKNPLFLKEDLENLKIRINYLEHKKFTSEMITHIIVGNPFCLTHSTRQIDEQLGFIQNNFHLTGDEVRLAAVKAPRLITTNIYKIKTNIFCLKEEMGFTDDELKKIILTKPLIYITGQDRLLKSFEYLHRDMNISLERIVEEPDILTCRKQRLMERHLFLVKLGRAQYNPREPNYVSLMSLVSGSDATFSTEVAKSSIQAYNAFLKSL